jgi:membrane dipeptidase
VPRELLARVCGGLAPTALAFALARPTTIADNGRATAMALTRRDFLRQGLLAGAGALSAPMLSFGRAALFADGRVQHSIRAIDLISSTEVIDMLGLLTLDWPRFQAWHQVPGSFVEEDYRRLRGSGIDVFHPAVEPNHPRPYEATRSWVANWHTLLYREARNFRPVLGIEDFAAAKRERRFGILIGFQNSEHFRTRRDVELFHELGQRVSQLTYDDHNRLGSGCRAERDRGLSAFGAEIVGEMNLLGMAIDVSHCGERTTLDAFAASRAPVLVTHSN